jgi:hypothetical protein
MQKYVRGGDRAAMRLPCPCSRERGDALACVSPGDAPWLCDRMTRAPRNAVPARAAACRIEAAHVVLRTCVERRERR